ncbi:MAG: ester cyclase, partial [Anaerolineales bacterium]|nr:ester cyclase [Anaerolineales bacterium]
MSEQNKALERRWFEEVWNQGNVASYEELASPDLVVHNSPPGITGDFEGVKQAISIHRTGYPDLHFEIEDQLAEGDKVVTRSTLTGTHRGEWVGIPPTGKRVSIEAITIQRWRGGKMVEAWLAMDMLGWMQQLGVVPPLG